MPPEHADTSTVTVTGTGTSRVAPDSAVARVGAVGRGTGVAEAYDAMRAAAATLTEVAVRHTEPRRVGSTGVSVWASHDHTGQRDGYEARHSFSIGCDDLATAGAMLGELASEVGDALVVDGVALEVTQDHGAGAAAREAAFQDARERAAALGRMAGAGLGRVLTMVEGEVPPGPGQLPKLAMVRDSGGGLEPGEATVTVSVTAVWELLHRGPGG